jgi:hypothetical protein
MQFCEMQQLKLLSLVNTLKPKQSVSISAKPVALNCLEAKPSFILDAGGHPSMRQQKMTPLSFWKIVP